MLKILAAFGPDESYIREVEMAAGLKPGAAHPILEALEHDGWLESRWEDIDERVAARRRRRYFKLTALGARESHALLARTAEALQA